ncbi:MAG: hypothetical protein J5871_07180 [Bacteroidales bacterium]|nr:hypothetical protein [Bacteroidales bacterium]
MKRLRHILPLLLCLLFLSCAKGDGVLFRSTVMGTVDEAGTFYDDAGWAYDFVDGQPDFTQVREIVCCDILRVDETARRYEAMLRELYHPLYREPLRRSEMAFWEQVGHDPIRLTALWYGGGCLNMSFQLSYGSASAGHDIQLVWDDTDLRENTLRFYLRHDAAGDTDESTANLDASFPISALLPEGPGQLAVELIWEWGGLSRISKLALQR